jgi:hypothetical protein
VSFQKKVGVCNFGVYFSPIGALFELVLLYWMLVFDPYTVVFFLFASLCIYIWLAIWDIDCIVSLFNP